MNKYFYHFSHLDNLDSILKNGLVCTNRKLKLGLGHYNIANKSIQDRRSKMEIICEDGLSNGVVHDYVPFYFSTRTPMLLSLINQKKVDQPEIIFFGVKTEMIKSENFIFTDASANTIDFPNFYKNFENLDKLNWEVINSKKWSYTPIERHQKMAEVLIKDFSFIFVDHIVVFNEHYQEKVSKILDENGINPKPKIVFEPHNCNYFYYTKFSTKGKEKQNLVIGPKSLKNQYDYVNYNVNKLRLSNSNFNCVSITELLDKLDNNFCYLEETAGIFELATSNDMHDCTVSDHTLEVVENLKKNQKFKDLDEQDKSILLLSAYLHDIGKGPHTKWPDQIQPNYPDHPYDSLEQCQRILIEEIENLNEEQIRILTLLIGYHDILGDLSKDSRNTIELKKIIKNEKDLMLLYILSQADILAINIDWYNHLNSKFEEIKNKVLK